MEKFFLPKDKVKFISWLLGISNDNKWTIVLEHAGDETYKFLVENATEVKLPTTTEHHYEDAYQLTAVINPKISKTFLNDLLAKCSVLSVHNEKEMVFLIADDFHEECFSCTPTFFDKYYHVLTDLDLIDINQENEKTRFELR